MMPRLPRSTFCGAVPFVAALTVATGSAVATAPTRIAEAGRVAVPGAFTLFAGRADEVRVIGGFQEPETAVGHVGVQVVDPPVVGPLDELFTVGRNQAAGTQLTPDGAVSWVAGASLGPESRLEVITSRVGQAPQRELIAEGPTFGHQIAEAGGLTVLTFDRPAATDGSPSGPMIAVRPKGAATFLPPVPNGAGSTIVLAPDGTGVLLSIPTFSKQPVTLNRIDGSGRIGPAVAVSRGPSEQPEVETAWDAAGNLVVAVANRRAGDLTVDVSATTLPAGASQPTKIRAVAKIVGPIHVEDNLGVVVTPAGRTVLTAGAAAPQRLLVYEGRGAALKRTDSIVARETYDSRLAVTQAGGLAVVWSGATSAKRRHRALMLAVRAPGRTAFSQPLVITEPRRAGPRDFDEVELRDALELPGGRFAVAYGQRTSTGPYEDYVSRFTLPSGRR